MNHIVGDRFWAKVNKTDGCWNWTAAKARGYGRFKIEGKLQYAHRLAYQGFVGAIPTGMLVDHICRNRACVRPSHLRLATTKQNLENLSGSNRGSTSNVRGVSWYSRDKKWQAKLGHNYKTLHLGYYDNVADAEAVVIAKRNELFTHNDVDRVAR